MENRSSRNTKIISTAAFSIALNILLAVVKFIGGILGHSFALVADGIESASDAVAGTIVFFGLKYAQKPADKNHPYGHGKAEALTTFIIVGFMLVSATTIIYQSVLNFFTPQEIPEFWTLYVMGGIIVWKELSFQWVKYQSKITKSHALAADAWHHRSDAITTVAAFIGVVLALIFEGQMVYADEAAALIAGVVIFYSAYKVFRPALGEVMDETIDRDLEQEIRKLSLEVNGIRNTEKLRLRKSGMDFHLDLHARVNGKISVDEGHRISHDLVEHLKSELPELGVISIHIEPE